MGDLLEREGEGEVWVWDKFLFFVIGEMVDVEERIRFEGKR